MRSRTSPAELAEVLARNSDLSLRRPAKALAAKTLQGIRESQSQANSASTRHTSRVDYKAQLVEILRFRGIQVEPEFKIFKNRRFRADWRVVDAKVLIEYEGGLFMAGKGGHSSVKGILRDVEKGNLCAIAGWIVIRVCPNHIDSGEALVWIEAAIEETLKEKP